MDSFKVLENANEEFSDDSLLDVVSYGADLSVREISSMFDEGELIKPSMQRNYVWTKKEASRFIESILMGLPVPSIFLAKDKDGRMLIVDGFQRINTLSLFLKGKFKEEKDFKLINSPVINERWRNKSIFSLDEESIRRFKTYTLHAIIFENKSRVENSAMYQIFERINTGGRILKPQEIRNCVYHGELNNFLAEMNLDYRWRTILSSSKPDERMRDVELLLRFLVLTSEFLFNKGSLGKTLNAYMEKNRNFEIDSRDDVFKRIDTTLTYLNNIFVNLNKINRNTRLNRLLKNPLLIETLLVSSFLMLKYRNFDYCNDFWDFSERINILIEDKVYNESIRARTSDINLIKMRINRALNILYGFDNDCFTN